MLLRVVCVIDTSVPREDLQIQLWDFHNDDVTTPSSFLLGPRVRIGFFRGNTVDDPGAMFADAGACIMTGKYLFFGLFSDESLFVFVSVVPPVIFLSV